MIKGLIFMLTCINTNISWKLAKFRELLILYHKTNIQPTPAFTFIVIMVFPGSVDTSIYKVQFNNVQYTDNNNVDQLKVWSRTYRFLKKQINNKYSKMFQFYSQSAIYGLPQHNNEATKTSCWI